MKTNIESIENFNYHKIIVVGCPGSGKSVFSLALSKILNIDVIHLDKIYWKPNWVNIDSSEFDRRLALEMNKDSYIIDGNYNKTIKERIIHSDLIVYLDYDSNVCIESYLKRVENGSIQGLISDGCVEEADREFIEEIKTFNDNYRSKYYNLLEESGKKYLIFNNREELQKFLTSLKEEFLSIKEFNLNDISTTFEYLGDLENAYYMYFYPVKDIEQVKEYIENCIKEYISDNPPYLSYAVTLNSNHIGSVFAYIDKTKANIGWIINKKYWSEGYAFLSTKLLINKLKGMGINYLVAYCDERNLPSKRVMEKLGMEFVGINGTRVYNNKDISSAHELKYHKNI